MFQPARNAEEADAKLALDQLRLAMRNMRPNALLMPVFGAIIWVMFAQWVPQERLALWYGVLLLGLLPQGAMLSLFLKREVPPARARLWIVSCALAYGAFAVAWTSMGFLLWMPGNNFGNLLIVLLVCCTLAGNTAIVGASVPLSAVCMAVYGGALIFFPLREGVGVYNGLAALAVIFVAYMVHIARSIHMTARDMLMLREERGGLIDRLIRAKSESDRARERAEQASQAKSQFLANMSHELRTPLNAILGFSELIESGVTAARPEKTQDYAKSIHESGAHLLTLINDILDLAKIEAGSTVLHEGEVALAQVLCESVKLLEQRAAGGQVTLLCDCPADLPALRGDQRALRQVILNLISNAVKFTPPGGTVTGFARLTQSGALAFGVRDTGVGIAEEDLARVFEKFGQGRHDIVTADKGTGLGLAIVKGLVEAHGGSVTLESRVGEGTCVTVTLPAERCLHGAVRKSA